ncbi:hypothetical protein ACSV5M_14730 [Cellvibrio sp. ARAG 10.3]|uniref:hypothetical protein n=1 Tax=Cellvibrio sp. ARAG 10.3 TaxID=3451358 RepID=UPI003F464107
MSGAMTIAEGDLRFKVDVSVVFGGGAAAKKYVLRTTLDSIGVWKAKYVKVNTSPFQGRVKTTLKDAAIIDKEVWVFNVDATRSVDVVAAIEIAMKVYQVPAADIIRDIYVKNLNIESENLMESQAKVRANKALYKNTCNAIREAAEKLGVRGEINLWVFSSNVNPKIPQQDLHQSLNEGGARSVATDELQYKIWSGSNDGERAERFKTNLHLAKFTL